MATEEHWETPQGKEHPVDVYDCNSRIGFGRKPWRINARETGNCRSRTRQSRIW
jgi:hypothetical protein